MPPGHCFDEESSKDIIDLEVLSIENFQSSILQIRKNISVFKSTQDVRCKQYEDDARTYIRDMDNAERAAADASGAYVSKNVSFLIIISFYVRLNLLHDLS